MRILKSNVVYLGVQTLHGCYFLYFAAISRILVLWPSPVQYLVSDCTAHP